MRKRWIFVKGYPFDCPNSKTKIFHNHQLNLIESELFKNLSFSQPFFRTKWFISFKLWWKKTTKSDFKIYLKLNSHRFSWKSLIFKSKIFFVNNFFNFLNLIYIGKSIFSQNQSYFSCRVNKILEYFDQNFIWIDENILVIYLRD